MTWNTRLERAMLTSSVKFYMSSQPAVPDITALIASNKIAIKLCFLQRSMSGSETKSKCVKKVVLILITSTYYVEI